MLSLTEYLVAGSLRELDLSADLIARHHEVMRCLGLLSKQIGTDDWCLVGGMMVLAAARSVGRADSRAERTKDGDVLIDVVAEPSLLERTIYSLQSMGYDLPPEADFGSEFARCTFVSGHAQVDVLAPDDAASDQLDVGPMRTIAIPGGRRALRGSELTRITYADDAFDVDVRVPTLPTAICVKAAAAFDPRTSGEPRHIQDTAFLLACIDDLESSAAQFDHDDMALLRRLHDERLLSERDVGWASLADEDRARGRAALEFLTQP